MTKQASQPELGWIEYLSVFFGLTNCAPGALNDLQMKNKNPKSIGEEG